MRRIRLPKHWLNLCKACGYTWYPKGKAVSMQCPRCGNRNVTLAPLGCGGCLKGCGWLIIIVFVLSGLSRGCSPSRPVNAPVGVSPMVPADIPSFSVSPSYTPVAVSRTATPAEVRRALPVQSSPPVTLPANSDLPPPIAPPGGYTVTGVAADDTLNVRSGPGANYAVVAKLHNGSGGIEITGAPVMNGPTAWVKITVGNHQTGWVTPNHLKAN